MASRTIPRQARFCVRFMVWTVTAVNLSALASEVSDWSPCLCDLAHKVSLLPDQNKAAQHPSPGWCPVQASEHWSCAWAMPSVLCLKATGWPSSLLVLPTEKAGVLFGKNREKCLGQDCSAGFWLASGSQSLLWRQFRGWFDCSDRNLDCLGIDYRHRCLDLSLLQRSLQGSQGVRR